MADDFNPYREWLGLKSPAAPNYYELLSLPQFVAEIREIGPAAARATTRVRSFRPGSNAAAWSRLLDEIQAARQCLTDPVRRAEYDEALRRGSEQPAAHEPPAEASAAPSALAAMAPDFYPPGMGPARPQPAPATIVANTSPTSISPARPPSDLDPPALQAEPAEPMFVEAEAEPGAADFTESPATKEVSPAAADVGETIVFESSLPLSAMPAAVPFVAMPTDDVGAAPSQYSGESVPTYDSAPAYNAAGYAPVAAYPAATIWQPEAAGYAAVPEAYAIPSAAAANPDTAMAPTGFESPGTFAAAEVPLSAGVSAPAVAARRGPRRGSNLMLVAGVCLGLLAAAAAGMILGPQVLGDRAATVAENKSKSIAPPPGNKETQPTVAVGPAITKAPEPPSAPIAVTSPADPPAPTLGPAPTSTPITDADPPGPASSPTPSPAAPPPVPAPAPEPAKVAREDVQALVKALESATKYFGEQKFNAADVQMEKAESLAKLPEHKQAVARLKEAGRYARQFREAVAAAIGGMQAGETFKVGSSTQVSFVEALPDKVIFRISGMNRTYAFEDLPPGLAVVVADMKLPEANLQSKIVKGAYLALHQRGDSQTIDKARSLWEEAKAAGANVDNLLPLLDDDYAEWLKDSP